MKELYEQFEKEAKERVIECWQARVVKEKQE